MNKTLTALAIGGTLLAAGCSGSDQPASAPSPAPTAPSSIASTPAANPTNSPLPVGTEHTVTVPEEGVTVRITVFSVTQDAAPSAPAPPSGGHWVAADIQTCLDATDVAFTVSWNPWSAVDASYGTYPASSLRYNQFPLPAYPFSDTPIAVGDCVRGNVVFPVPDGTAVARVKYAPAPSMTVSWTLE